MFGGLGLKNFLSEVGNIGQYSMLEIPLFAMLYAYDKEYFSCEE
jgi:hypothetical protein